MNNNFVFSWAENMDGRMVHVDDVPRGLNCGCICPHCHEKLLARHGNVNEHGFAHHSDMRGANLKICYMVILYKLAEQIIQTKKKIQAPSYYGIFKSKVLEFENVRVDCRYEREDKQPDIIATTADGEQYLIEFVFNYKVQHKQSIDYKTMSCIEIDLSNQSLETLESFLLSSSEDRKWLNNEIYFNKIEDTYLKANKSVKIVNERDCVQCQLWNNCCAVMKDISPLVIENNGERYRLCKTAQYQQTKDALMIYLAKEECILQERKTWSQGQRRSFDGQVRLQESNVNLSQSPQIGNASNKDRSGNDKNQGEKSCFNCQSNLAWANRGDGWAHCGCYISLGLPRQKINPNHAKTCNRFRLKEQ